MFLATKRASRNMYGTNPKRPPEKGDGQTLQVQEIFPTLQGEGPRAGQPAVFIRLGGCNLACEFCDTEFESFSTRSLDSILDEVLSHTQQSAENTSHTPKLIVITGGEPLRQPIELLCKKLISLGFIVQIETNGTIYRELPEAVEWVCSPKPVNGQYFPLRPDVLSAVNALKFIVALHAPYNDVPALGQTQQTIYVQPMDEGNDSKNNTNQQLAIQLCQTKGYRLSLQLHKMIGLP